MGGEDVGIGNSGNAPYTIIHRLYDHNLPKMRQEGAAWSAPIGKVAKELGYKRVNVNIQKNNGNPHVTAEFS